MEVQYLLCNLFRRIKFPGNLMLALGDSVSFGRFLNESLSWEKKSAFSRKNYVEEAEHYSRPGSVAQKKAFFEAHYKRIAAKKAAADVLEQDNAVTTDAAEVFLKNNSDDEQSVELNARSNVDAGETMIVKIPEGSETVKDKENFLIQDLEKQHPVSAFEDSKTPKMESSSAKADSRSKDGSNLSSLDASIQQKTRNDQSASAKQVSYLEKQSNASQCRMESSVNSMDVKELHSKSDVAMTSSKKYPSKSLSALMMKPAKDSERELISSTMKTENSGVDRSSDITAQSNGVSSNPVVTSQPESTRTKTAPVSSTQGSKSSKHKWHLFPAVFSKSLTEKNAANSKQKLEEKFEASESQKMQPRKSFKDKAGSKVRKLRCIFCFKASPLLDQRGTPENQGNISMPSPCSTSLVKNSSTDNRTKMTQYPTKSFAERIAFENLPPNIHQ